jgi:plastocyanin
MSTTMTSTRSALTVLTVAVLALAACGRDSSTSVTSGPTSSNGGAESSTPATTLTSGGGSTEATAATLTISGRAFGSVAVKAGMPITIVNEDAFRHTVTHRIPGDRDLEGKFDVTVAGNSTVTFAIDEPGTYMIVCKIHPDMGGEITVD